MAENFAQILVLLSVSVSVIVIFQRLHIPTSLGYLLVGIILSPHTIGPALDVPEIKGLAEFGVVFLLFTIGLNYSLPQLHALRGQVLGLGTTQVALGTAVVMGLAMLAGMPTAAAFIMALCLHNHRARLLAVSLLSRQSKIRRMAALVLPFRCFKTSLRCRFWLSSQCSAWRFLLMRWRAF